ncbi:carbamoyltransferase HypF [Geotalea sp. SG265]|uniref:carbamoyltransferase HypF n=1 Tax=Geotalea sp. SG265 TaxID=2922867 RepID=UPI001FB021A7|nr:carbamoyltransferase HypF [Geotalea sp. SG265]
MRVEIAGIVQGVGFRPFLYRLATANGVSGWVRNTTAGVVAEVEGDEAVISRFLKKIEEEAPPLAAIARLQAFAMEPRREAGFVILPSGHGEGPVQIAPDSDVCPDCLRELFDPADRRYRYPFITCTNCGPRYSIVTGVPYDRPFTTMAGFPLCDRCREEYETPGNRRFHAQPIACPVCGPRLRLLGDGIGNEDPLAQAVRLLREGRILAIKGIGGYHLAVDACNDRAVRRLRRRKKRDEKPFALMVPDPEAIDGIAFADESEQRLLGGAERPIVLLRKREGSGLSLLIAPANGYLGVMLPSSPLHHLLLADNFSALVMTSGNVSDEPIAYREADALARLGDIADCFLTHDRGIHTRIDDSVVRVFQGGPLVLRRSRGYVPRSIRLPFSQTSILAVGGELKAAVCLTAGDQACLSQHIGDLKNVETLASLEETAAHLKAILDIEPAGVAHDLHPDYLSTRYAGNFAPLPRIGVQHHHAHMASCMAENGLEGEVLGVVFDGTGYGTDGTIWGGEFLLGDYRGFERAAHFRNLPLPGGDAAVREPYRMALSCLYSLFGTEAFDLPLACCREVQESDRELFLRMLERGINSPPTSSCGRLFDAVASILGLRQRITYEGQAAMELEGLAEGYGDSSPYPFVMDDDALNFTPMIRAIVEELSAGRPRAEIAGAFHTTIAAATAEMCGRIRQRTGLARVVLSGGVFQNRLLAEDVVARLARHGFQVFTHRLVPPNDGGLALGQAVVAGQHLV